MNSTPSFEELTRFLTERHNLHPMIAASATRYEYLVWMGTGSVGVEAYLSGRYDHLPKDKLIEYLRPPAKPRGAEGAAVTKSYTHLRGGIKGKVREAMAKKSVKLYSSAQLQTITKNIKSLTNSLPGKNSEDIEVRIHAFPREEGEKTFPLEVTLITEQHMRRLMIDPQGDLQWEQRYDCALTYDTYGSLTEGDDIESGYSAEDGD